MKPRNVWALGGVTVDEPPTAIAMTRAESHAATLAALVPDSAFFAHPDRNVTWKAFASSPKAEVATAFKNLLSQIARLDAPDGVFDAVEGVFRVTFRIGGGAKFWITAAVVHVIADGEPLRTVIIPLEKKD